MKLKFYLTAGTCIAAVALLGPGSALAAPKQSSAPSADASPSTSNAAAPGQKAGRVTAFRGTVSSVDAAAGTFTIVGKKKTRVFKVTDKTSVTKDGAAATIADITANERVIGSFWRQEDGSLEAKTVKIGGKGAGGKSGKKRSKKADADADPASAEATASPSASPKK